MKIIKKNAKRMGKGAGKKKLKEIQKTFQLMKIKRIVLI